MKNEEKVTWRETWQLSKRAFLLLDKYVPNLYLSMTLCAVVSAIIPYVTVFLSARIIDELAGARRPEILGQWIITAVAVDGTLTLLRFALTHWKSTRTDVLAHNRTYVYADKMLSMDFVDLENQTTSDLLAQITQNEQWMGLGLQKIPYLYEGILQNAVGIVSSLALTVGLFLTRTPAGAGALTRLDGPVGILALVTAVTIPTALGPWLWGKTLRYDQGAAGSELNRQSNRLFSAFGFLAKEQSQHLDIRIYDQQAISRHYALQNRTYDADGPFAKMHAGRWA